jgi:hypothetical protein
MQLKMMHPLSLLEQLRQEDADNPSGDQLREERSLCFLE